MKPDRATLLAMLADGPLALWPEWLARLSGGNDVAAAIPSSKERAAARKQGAVAVVPVNGVIMGKPNIFEDYGFGISTQTISRNLRAAIADPDVKAVVLDIDSPGGTVSGVPELAAEIMALRGSKPIVAQANFMAASAAYWIASAADEIVASPSALVGSIGVYLLHMDYSKALELAGIKPTFMSAGEHKTEGNPYEPLTDEAKQGLQAEVDAVYASFVRDVAMGRGASIATVKADYGKGRVLMANEAKRVGMIDKVRPIGETFAAYGILQADPPRARRALGLLRRRAELNLI